MYCDFSLEVFVIVSYGVKIGGGKCVFAIGEEIDCFLGVYSYLLVTY